MNDVGRDPGLGNRDSYGAGGRLVIHLHGAVGDSLFLKSPQNSAAKFVFADARHDAGVRAKGAGVIGKIGRRAAKLRARRKQVPKDFADSNDFETHGGPYSIPKRIWICSSGTPLVSGTMVFTQISCRTIIKVKNEKIYPGGNTETIFGKKVVSRAAKTQWVVLPSVCPSARCRLGKISEISTQITAP